ncbi:SidA/IucD/PvdA family monooxygenase [Phycicoccus sp. CSK15P-2]|uniref:lysine N(6)-hydroxylase/L-ornithine N(5)-oxygenase family protein n=1 Tax=Phycicoccus sp. CSK15P-2 TaxID=2807627 RepID=UPI00194E4F88|nr:SidA/IucD/PvdA family monooxygenase [Phycicoccus sp. CSK15P-2]MBM6403045.1 SidA/IucD/PvdA family monooxygenase [Phycicoccus sp. CSK15P-2]
MSRVHDVLAVGLGPFNLGLAALAEPHDLDLVVLESRGAFDWHPGMMLPDASLQVPFLADLVSLADPTSRYSFLAWLKRTGRLYPFYVRETFHPLRAEYTAYCRWVAEQLPGIETGRRVERVQHDGEHYVVVSRDPVTGERHHHRTRRLVVGTGTPVHVPDGLRPAVEAAGPSCHTSDYTGHREALHRLGHVTVVGGGQSAAEVVADLLDAAEAGRGPRVTWVTRSPRFLPLDVSKLTLEMTSPEYVRHFHGLPPAQRDRLLASQQGLYKGISADLVDALHERLYRMSLDGPPPCRLLTCTEVTGAEPGGAGVGLDLRHTETGEAMRLDTDAVIAATGYRAGTPPVLDGIADRLRFDARGRLDVLPHYAVDHAGDEVFVQNAELHTHGFTAPDLGMGAHRNSVILNRVLGREVYRVEERIAFQEFGVPADLAVRARTEVGA